MAFIGDMWSVWLKVIILYFNSRQRAVERKAVHMNKVILMGRLTRDPEMRYATGQKQMPVARYTLAVDRRFRRQNEGQQADFINCVAFGRAGEFADNYLHQGTKIIVSGRIQTGSYKNKSGQSTYTTEVVVEEQEFAENKAVSESNAGGRSGKMPSGTEPVSSSNGFMNVPDGVEDELPFIK